MEIYLVGGAVRDKLLNLPVKERDWVVVGATEQELIAKGYTPVGKDFPVFLHPDTKEEYALARTERKTGKGHREFICDANADVSLEQDLLRRDLTINAMAEDNDGALTDPYGGKNDLEDRLLRHVSDAFAEDPLRILRVARFAARFPEFTIHDDTRALMNSMVRRGELTELVPERIYAELNKALSATHPLRFFEILSELDTDNLLWPEISSDGLSLLGEMSKLTDDHLFRTTALLWALDKNQIESLGANLRLPGKVISFGYLANEAYQAWQGFDELNATDIVDWFYQVDAFRRNDRFVLLNDFFHHVSKILGRTDNATKWETHYEIARNISAKEIMEDYSGKALGVELRNRQIEAVEREIRK